ncbi:MAG: HEPN domain-containing protein [Tannerellaceae bacterium]|nr:HEPN domain-containing protein [Tannerellaceae bacterium]
MTLSAEERNAIVNNRIEKSKQTLNEAKRIIELELWPAAANRLYYAAYNIVTALLIKNGYTTQTHAGVIRLLGLHFIKPGIIPTEIGNIYTRLFELRQSGDYDDWRIIGEADVKLIEESAERFIQTIEKLLNQ